MWEIVETHTIESEFYDGGVAGEEYVVAIVDNEEIAKQYAEKYREFVYDLQSLPLTAGLVEVREIKPLHVTSVNDIPPIDFDEILWRGWRPLVYVDEADSPSDLEDMVERALYGGNYIGGNEE